MTLVKEGTTREVEIHDGYVIKRPLESDEPGLETLWFCGRAANRKEIDLYKRYSNLGCLAAIDLERSTDEEIYMEYAMPLNEYLQKNNLQLTHDEKHQINYIGKFEFEALLLALVKKNILKQSIVNDFINKITSINDKDLILDLDFYNIGIREDGTIAAIDYGYIDDELNSVFF